MNYSKKIVILLMILVLGLTACSQKDVTNEESNQASDQEEDQPLLESFKENKLWGFKDQEENVVIEPQYDEVKSFENGFAEVSINDVKAHINKDGEFLIPENVSREQLTPHEIFGKYGYINSKKQLVVLPKYKYVDEFSEGIAPVREEEQWGFIDRQGDFVIKPTFDRAYPFSEGYAKIRIDHQYSFIDKSGTIVFDPKYNKAKNYSEGLAAVQKGSQWGYIDKEGEFVVQPKYTGADHFVNGIAIVRSNRGYGYVDKDGNQLTDLVFKSAEKFEDGQARVRYHKYYGIIDRNGNFIINETKPIQLKKISGKYGYMNGRNRLASIPKYDEAYPFEDGKALVRIQDDWGYINRAGESEELFKNKDQVKVKIGDKVGILNKDGQFVIPEDDKLKPWRYNGKSGYLTEKFNLIAYSPKFENVSKFYEGISVFQQDDRWGYIDDNGRILFEPQFSEVETFSGEAIVKVKKGQKEGLINKEGEVVLDIIFDNISDFDNGIAEVKLDDYNGYIDIKGNLIYDKNSKLIPKKLDNSWGYIDENNNIAIAPNFIEAKEFIDGYAFVKKRIKSRESKWGIINKKRDFVVKPIYDTIEPFNENMYKVKKDNMWGIVDNEGKIIQNPIFYEIRQMTDEIYKIIKNSKQGLLNKNGEIVLEPIYNHIFEFEDEKVKVIKGNRFSFVGNNGELLEEYKTIDMEKDYDEMDIENLDTLIDTIRNYITVVDQVTADQMLIDLINILKEEKIPEIRYQFDYGDNPDLSDKYIKTQLWFESDQSYIFTPDYERIMKLHKDEISKAFYEYLEIIEKNANSPIAIDDGMLISFDELADRTINYELYLQKHNDFELSDEIMRLYKRELGSIILGRGYFERGIIGRMPDAVYEKILNSEKNIPLTKKIIQRLVDKFENHTTKIDAVDDFLDQSMKKIDSYFNELNMNPKDVAVKRFLNNLKESDFKISRDELSKLLSSSKDLTIIDIRDEEKYNQGHMKDAVNLPFGPKIGENISKIPLDKPIIVIGNKDIIEEQVVSIFKIIGANAQRLNRGKTSFSEDDQFQEYITTQTYNLEENNNNIAPELKESIEKFFVEANNNQETIFENFYLVGGESGIEKSDFEKFKETEENYITVSLKDDDTGRYYTNWDVIISIDNNMYSDLKELPKDQKIFIGQVLSTQYFNKITVGLRILGYDAYGLLVAE